MKEDERKIIQEFLPYVRTKGELDHLKDGLERLIEALYRHGADAFTRVLETAFPEGFARHLGELFRRPPYEGSRNAREEFLTNLLRSLKWVRPVRIELAFEPSGTMIEAVSDWVRSEAGGDTVLDIAVDPSILGGARFSFGGRYKAYTLTEFIDRILEEKRNEIFREVQSSRYISS